MSQLSYKEIIENQLPRNLYKSRDIESQTIGNSLDKVQNDIDDLEKEVNPITAVSKGFEQWERFFKLPSNVEDSIEIRKARVIAELIQFMSDENIIRKDEMEAILSFFGQVEIIEHFAEYVFDVVFMNVKTLNINEIVKVIKKIKPSWLDYRLNTQYSKELQLQTKQETYPINYNRCGNFLCGTKPYVQTEGIGFNTQLNVNTNKTNTSQRYKLTGTFKSGEAKL
ncbi:putative phage tail protein [Tissierella praeacuta]|uniref:putative phage tail protein n=1 Tax=Tissierella praeacuta TaxID=43131 RepID=UPI002FD8C7C1